MKKSIYKFLLIGILGLAAILIGRVYIGTGHRFLRLVLLFLMVAEASTLFSSQVIKGTMKSIWKNIWTMAYTLFFFLIVIESVLMFVPRSHRSGYSLAAQIWRYKYWEPVNPMGFRDVTPASGDDSVIIFVGDSYTAGNGVKREKDRFSDRVRAAVNEKGAPYTVANIGVSGHDTREEYESLQKFLNTTGSTPSKIVLQYTGNDIFDLGLEMGLELNLSDGLPKGPLAPLIEGSYMLNYVYWKLPNEAESNAAVNFYEEAFNSEEIFGLHASHLQRFIDFADENNVELTVLIMPFLQQLELSEELFSGKISRFFENSGIKVIDIADLVSDMDPMDRVVNSDDAHSSVEVNKRIADELIKAYGLQ